MRKRQTLFVTLCLVCLSAWAQELTTLTVRVTTQHGEPVAGTTVALSNTEYGLMYPDVIVDNSGIAVFTSVLTTTNTLTVDGREVGLMRKVEEIAVTANMVHDVTLAEETRQPYALRANLHHDVVSGKNSVRMAWNREDPAINDDFESYEDFAIHFEPWTGIDADKAPAVKLQGSYANAQLEQYATIFNPITIEPSVWFEYPVLRPYSGAKYVAFLTTSTGEPNNDYLISPRVHVGREFIIYFMAKAADRYNEQFRVGIAAGLPEGQSPTESDFTWLSDGKLSVDYRQWQPIAYSLDAYEGQDVYLCINYVSQQTFMLMVDDFYVGPSAKAVEPLNAYESHTILIDGDSVSTVKNAEYETPALAPGKHRLGVYTSYRFSHTDTIWTEVEIPTADTYARLSLELSTNNDKPVQGIEVLLRDTHSEEQYSQAAGESACEWLGLPHGEYAIRIEQPNYEQIDTVITLSADATIAIRLIERIVTPFNLYVELRQQGEQISGELMWNRDLGFSEGFEKYKPFAQSFGDWQTIDNDGGTNYAISLGGASIAMGDLGYSGKTSAMIFNPYETEPAVDVDTYFLAHKGNQYVTFLCPQGQTADDWLIAPAQKIGHDWILRFWGKAYSKQYPETVIVLARKEGQGMSDFVALDTVVYRTGDWTEYIVPLTAYEGQTVEIAFHYVSHDMWIAQMDDIYIGPKTSTDTEGINTGEAEFEIHLDGKLLTTTDETRLPLGELALGRHTATVQAIYVSGKSKVATLEFDVTPQGINDIQSSTYNTKMLIDGQLYIQTLNHIYNALGQKIIRK